MPDRLSILCVHGIGHGDSDPELMPSWRDAITVDLQRWTPGLQVDFDFLFFDDLFEHAPARRGDVRRGARQAGGERHRPRHRRSLCRAAAASSDLPGRSAGRRE